MWRRGSAARFPADSGGESAVDIDRAEVPMAIKEKKAKIKRLRGEIDRLDRQFVGLLEKRVRLASAIGTLKDRGGAAIHAPEREQQIYSQLARFKSKVFRAEDLKAVFREIIHLCRSTQKEFGIAYLGPEATFTHQVALRGFGRAAKYAPCRSIPEVFKSVEKGLVDYGVVPIENSLEGVVHETVDMFNVSEVQIAAEYVQEISHHLLSTSGDLKKIESVYSHPQALAQCRKWLDKNLPGVPTYPTTSTADAAMQAAVDVKAGAIASLFAQELYHLKVAASRIEDFSQNLTRFVALGLKTPPKTGADKTSLLCVIKDRAGALYEALEGFKRNGINLTKIESRPSKTKPWEYIFFVEFLGYATDAPVKKALRHLSQRSAHVKVLGSYPKA
ncbi:MAG: prephenate dehydratase [Elusimicrobiota bacterium]